MVLRFDVGMRGVGVSACCADQVINRGEVSRRGRTDPATSGRELIEPLLLPVDIDGRTDNDAVALREVPAA
jgi:hypothetical protein